MTVADLQMLESAIAFDWREGLGEAKKRFEKDWQRIRGFERASQKKLVALVLAFVSDPSQAQADMIRAFVTQSVFIVQAYAERAEQVARNPWKFMWPLNQDPFKGEREAVRRFAEVWDLDSEFRALLG